MTKATDSKDIAPKAGAAKEDAKSSAKVKVIAIKGVKHGEHWYGPGDEFTMEKAEAAALRVARFVKFTSDGDLPPDVVDAMKLAEKQAEAEAQANADAEAAEEAARAANAGNASTSDAKATEKKVEDGKATKAA